MDSPRDNEGCVPRHADCCYDSNEASQGSDCEPPKASGADSCKDSRCCQPSPKTRESDCCNSNLKRLDRCIPTGILPTACRNACCGGPNKAIQDTFSCGTNEVKVDDGCYTHEQDWEGNHPSAAEELNAEGPENPSCCEGKTYPCCDVSCLDRIALRECDKGKRVSRSIESPQAAAYSPLSSSCPGVEEGKPCEQHSRSTRMKYAATLEALGCVCRALLALGQESCCRPQRRSSFDKKRFHKRSYQSTPRASLDPCCAAGSFATETPPPSEGCYRNTSPKASGGACLNDCCSKFMTSTVPESVAYATKEKPMGFSENKESLTDVTYTLDVEKGITGNEHVILSITGMTCTGCETKLKRTLATLKSIKNLKTSLVLSRAEFDLDVNAGSLVEVIKHLERTTEFKCERILDRGSSVNITVPVDSSDFVKQDWPRGVTDLTVVDKNTVHVAFDAKIIGGRELVERGWSTPVNLAAPRADLTLEAGSKHVRYVGYMTLLSIALTIPVLVLAWAPLPKREIAYGSASLGLATIVQVFIAGPFYPKALKSLVFSRMIEMDLLIMLSTSAAFIFSVVSFGYLVADQPLPTGEFFETSTLLVTLIMVGRYVAALARQKAVESISIRSLQTPTAIIVDESGAQEKEIDVRLLQYGDIFKVAPDSKIPTDGTVIMGSSEVNESMITGEASPVEKSATSAVIAGSINGSGTLTVRLTRLPGDNTISMISGMVDEAKLSKPKIQDIADRVASYFVPTVVAVTIVTLVVWIAIGVAVRKQSGAEATTQAITYGITVLIVSCPCAIGLAVPMVIVIASGVAAERGVIFKSADSIEVACKASHVVFDKTGTLTQGKLTVAVEEYIDGNMSSTMPLLLSLIISNKHPVSAAVATHLKAKGISTSIISDPKILTGKGVKGSVSGMVLQAGNSRWLNVSSDPHVKPILARGYTAFCFTINDCLVAIFGLEDSLRTDALHTVTKLRERGLSVHVISGDDHGAVISVATLLGIPDTNVRSRCTPADKQAYIQGLLAVPDPRISTKNPKTPVVVFCGDGTNDAIALAQATIGVHMNEGTDVAKSAADVVLIRPNLTGILSMIAVSEITMNRIKFNFGWSFVYNVFAILLGAGAFVNARIPPEFAGLGELVSVVPVIAAAVLLRWSTI
ncbi:copper-translocating P-type ATPase [Talaromyces proteolyticus]|uniref:Copper-translocating P-type ATPase n=1 Tax=Talaromyces proteolyticus TaxID=1131652 RepID=A0AAD4KRB5_9EURO|nr:copper-translocating P-type ATPase [Talaromyces proteolyticus]KAH8697565.1 copper-translocating P-type ATPase [Talaromyces proteolyticus]